MIHGLGNLGYSDRLRSLNLTTLYYRRRRSDVIQVFRIIKNIDSITLEDFFKLDTGITRGNYMKLVKPRANTSIKLNSFSHIIINEWNDLPNYIYITHCFCYFQFVILMLLHVISYIIVSGRKFLLYYMIY